MGLTAALMAAIFGFTETLVLKSENMECKTFLLSDNPDELIEDGNNSDNEGYSNVNFKQVGQFE